MFFTFIHGYSENNENWIMMDADPVRYTTCCTDIAIAYERSIENQTALSLPLKYRCVCFEHSLFFFTVDYDPTLIFSKLLHKFDR